MVLRERPSRDSKCFRRASLFLSCITQPPFERIPPLLEQRSVPQHPSFGWSPPSRSALPAEDPRRRTVLAVDRLPSIQMLPIELPATRTPRQVVLEREESLPGCFPLPVRSVVDLSGLVNLVTRRTLDASHFAATLGLGAVSNGRHGVLSSIQSECWRPPPGVLLLRGAGPRGFRSGRYFSVTRRCLHPSG